MKLKKSFHIKVHLIFADYFLQKYKNSNQSYKLLARASHHYRYGQKPEISLNITDVDINTIDIGVQQTSILNTRGGAFKGIGEYDSAERLANLSLQIAQNMEANNLLQSVLKNRNSGVINSNPVLDNKSLCELVFSVRSDKELKLHLSSIDEELTKTLALTYDMLFKSGQYKVYN